jgi:hypothetical protein
LIEAIEVKELGEGEGGCAKGWEAGTVRRRVVRVGSSDETGEERRAGRREGRR